MTIQSYRDLTIWQDAIALATDLYRRSFVQFLRMAQGSLKEVETHLIIAENIGLISSEASQAELRKAESLGKRIRSLVRSLQERLEGER